MTVHISQTISNDQVKVRWQEPYTSGALNKKAYVTNPKGVYAGFTVVPGAALGLWIDIVRDPTLSASVAVVNENTGGKYALTFVTENDFSINLATVPGLPAYVNVCLDAQYTIGAATAAQFRVVDDAELVSNPDLIVLARVLVPAAGPIPAINISSAHRNAAGDAIQTLAKPRNNLVFNSGFESDDNAGAVAGWVSTGGGLVLTASTDNARTGTKSMKLSAAGAVTLQANSTVMPAVPGQEYRVGAWMRSTGASPISGGTGAQLRVTFFDKSFVIVGSTIDIDVAFTGGGTTYVERKAHVTAPVGCAHARLDVSFGNCAGVLYVDDVEFSTRAQDALAQSVVFGGPLSNADNMHTHSATGASYGGSGAWFDTAVVPPGTIESGLDTIVSQLAANAAGATGDGAGKIGAQATAGSPDALTASSVRGQVGQLLAHHNNHLNDATAAHAASAISNTPAGAIAATTVQAAINELDAEKASYESVVRTRYTINANQAPVAGGSGQIGLAIGFLPEQALIYGVRVQMGPGGIAGSGFPTNYRTLAVGYPTAANTVGRPFFALADLAAGMGAPVNGLFGKGWLVTGIGGFEGGIRSTTNVLLDFVGATTDTVMIVGGQGVSAIAPNTGITNRIINIDTLTGEVTTFTLNTARAWHTATPYRDTSNDIRLMVVGGVNGTTGAPYTVLNTSEGVKAGFNSPGAGVFGTARYDHAAVRLGDALNSNIIVIGGRSTWAGAAVSSTDLFTQSTNTWAAGPALPAAVAGGVAHWHESQSTALLFGGVNAVPAVTNNVYKLTGGVWSADGTFTTARQAHAVAQLQDGTYLIIGGSTDATDPSVNVISSVQRYTPGFGGVGSSTAAAPLPVALAFPTATTLQNGDVLVTGGDTGSLNTHQQAFLWDHLLDSWTTLPNVAGYTGLGANDVIANARFAHGAAMDKYGKVWIGPGQGFGESFGSYSVFGVGVVAYSPPHRAFGWPFDSIIGPLASVMGEVGSQALNALTVQVDYFKRDP